MFFLWLNHGTHTLRNHRKVVGYQLDPLQPLDAARLFLSESLTKEWAGLVFCGKFWGGTLCNVF